MGIEIGVHSYDIYVTVKYIDQYDDFIKDLEKTSQFNEYFVNKGLTNNIHKIILYNEESITETNDINSIDFAIVDIINVCNKYGYTLSFELKIMPLYGDLCYYYYIVKNNRLYEISDKINDAMRGIERNVIDSFMNSE